MKKFFRNMLAVCLLLTVVLGAWQVDAGTKSKWINGPPQQGDLVFYDGVTGVTNLVFGTNGVAILAVTNLTVDALNITGLSIFSDDVIITGDTTITGALVVAGAPAITGDAVLTGDLSLTGDSTFTGTVDVVGATEITGATDIAGALGVTGNAVITGLIASASETWNYSAIAYTGTVSRNTILLQPGVVNATTFLSAAASAGTWLYLTGGSTNAYLTNAAPVALSSNIYIGDNDVLPLLSDGTTWNQAGPVQVN